MDTIEFGMVRDWVLVLYGTVLPPQRNDSLILETSLKKKVGDSKINKKSKNQNQDAFIKQRNKNGRDKKNGILKTSTTFLPPAYSTRVDSLGDEYSKVPKFKKLNTDSYQVVTTSRPRVTVKLPTLKSHNENLNNLNTKKTSKIMSTYQPNNNNNKISGKLPKQVNNNLFSTESTVIPKKFGNYEKIEQFYPELRPVNEFNNPAFFTVTGMKIDNEDSKSTSMMPTNYFSQSIIGEGRNEPISDNRAKEQLKKMPKGTNTYCYDLTIRSVYLIL